jgi:hypothetical protein
VRGLAWVIFILAVAGILFCGYAYFFWAWVTATPLTPAELGRAQYNAYAWLALAGLSLVAAVVAFVFAMRQGRRKVGHGFQILSKGNDSAA